MKDIPVTVKRSLELLGLFLIGFIIVIGKIIIMPLLMSFFISIMLLPLFRFFRRLRLAEGLAIFLPILFMFIVMALIVWLFYNQMRFLLYDFQTIQQNLTTHLNKLSLWISRVFDFSPKEQVEFMNQQSNKLLNYAASIFSGAAGSATGTLIFLGLLPIYTFLLMMYRGILMKFILLCFEPKEHENIQVVTGQIENMSKRYLLGLLIQLCYITLLLWGILAVFGIKHALLIGIIFAFLNLIPYLGALIGNIIGVLITLASSESIVDILFVLGAIAAVQFLDNNILMPRIVGSQVKLNPLISLIGIIIAGAMTGVSGMFLALPIMAVLKIIFDRTEQFKKWGVLLGDERPAKKPMRMPAIRRRQKI
ncbi:AI-2E family transporter [Niastella caeni]|uniref:AI-2E family transporter n=1 Tax=Niastella caeni TaxID=2569763 RepID=A0A4S8HRS2_9BACT|nr:AI-2E family transporter [Niastella caeni]THU38217.1 AI-2E family transporter [Niastella caeni]